MKDRLKFSKWVNQPLKNPVQTRYRRFVKTPGAELSSPFTDSEKKFKSMLRDTLKTHYSLEDYDD